MKNLPENQDLVFQIKVPLLAITNKHAEVNQMLERENLTFSKNIASIGKIGCAGKNTGAKHNTFIRKNTSGLALNYALQPNVLYYLCDNAFEIGCNLADQATRPFCLIKRVICIPHLTRRMLSISYSSFCNNNNNNNNC